MALVSMIKGLKESFQAFDVVKPSTSEVLERLFSSANDSLMSIARLAVSDPFNQVVVELLPLLVKAVKESNDGRMLIMFIKKRAIFEFWVTFMVHLVSLELPDDL